MVANCNLVSYKTLKGPEPVYSLSIILAIARHQWRNAKSTRQSLPTNEADMALAFFPDLALEMGSVNGWFTSFASPKTQTSLDGVPASPQLL